MTTVKAKKSQGWASDTDSESEEDVPQKAPATVMTGSYKEIITGKPSRNAPVKAPVTNEVPETNAPKDLRDDGPRGGYRDNVPRVGYRDDGPRGGFRDDGPKGGFRDNVPRVGYRDDGPRGGFRDDGPRGGFRDDGPRGGYRDDGPRGGYRDVDGPRGGYRDVDGPRGGYRDDGPRGGYRDDGPRGGFRGDNFAPRAVSGQDVRGSQFDRSRNAPTEDNYPENENLRQLEQARLEREMLEKKRLAKLQQKEAKANMAADLLKNNAADTSKEENSRVPHSDRGGGVVLRDYIDRSGGNRSNGPAPRDNADRNVPVNKTNARDVDRSGPVSRDSADRNVPVNKMNTRDTEKTVNAPISIMKPVVSKEETKWERSKAPPVQKPAQAAPGKHIDHTSEVTNAMNNVSIASNTSSGPPPASSHQRPVANSTTESASPGPKRASYEDSAEAIARKQIRDKARAERGPRTKGFLYKYNEKREIVEVVTVPSVAAVVTAPVDSGKTSGRERSERRPNTQRDTLTSLATTAMSSEKGGHYNKKHSSRIVFTN